jgi:hypothetical protein
MKTTYCVVIHSTIAVVIEAEHPGQAAVFAHDALREQAFPKGVVRGPEKYQSSAVIHHAKIDIGKVDDVMVVPVVEEGANP